MSQFELNPEIKKPRPDVSRMLAALEEYNRYFSMGASMGRGLMGGFGEGNENRFQDEEKLQEQKFEALKKDNQSILNETGLSLESVDAPVAVFGISRMSPEEMQSRVQAFSEETGITREDLKDENSYKAQRAAKFMEDLHKEASAPLQITEMRINLSNPKNFLAYLNSLKGAITQQERVAIEKIASILKQQLIWKYDVSNPDDDRFMNLIGSLEKIIVAYEELGLTPSVAKLRELLMVSRAKYLKEFLMVKRADYLSPHEEGFGPARWHKDCNSENYNSRWSEAVGIYKQTLKNPNALDLSIRLKKQLLEAVDIAEREIKSKPLESDYEKSYFPEFIETLEIVKAELQ